MDWQRLKHGLSTQSLALQLLGEAALDAARFSLDGMAAAESQNEGQFLLELAAASRQRRRRAELDG